MVESDFAIDIDIVDHAQGHAVPEDTQMMAIYSDFVVLELGEDDDFECFTALHPAKSVAFLLLPLSVLHVISHNDFVLGSDAEMENYVLIAVE